MKIRDVALGVALAFGVLAAMRLGPAEAQLTDLPSIMGDAVAAGTSDFTVSVPAGYYDLTVVSDGAQVKFITLPEFAGAPYDSVPVGDGFAYTAEDVYLSGVKFDRTSSTAVTWYLEKAAR